MLVLLDLRAPLGDNLIEPATIEANAQAAEVCFDKHHRPPVALTVFIDGIEFQDEFEVHWQPISAMQLRTHGNRIDATEDGAYAVMLASLRVTHELFGLGRSDALTGADYYAVPGGASNYDAAYRIEVSGTQSDEIAKLNERVREKVRQLKAGASNLPGIAVVVGFQCRVIKMQAVL